MPSRRLIESDQFPFEFLSALAERESWRKEVHRPIYHVHKWWAKRLGSVFRGLALGSMLPEDQDLAEAFFRPHEFRGSVLFDPFMGSGTTVGEAHKLGFTALGRDINPVAAEAVRIALTRVDPNELEDAFAELSRSVGTKIRRLYRSEDSRGRFCEVLYYFWAMQCPCPACSARVDLLPSWIVARNAYPGRKPQVQVLCPSCGELFPALHGESLMRCTACGEHLDPNAGPARGARAACRECGTAFVILNALAAARSGPPCFRLFGKLVLTRDGKEYLRASEADQQAYRAAIKQLDAELRQGTLVLPQLELTDGYNTRQAMAYGFLRWRDFFNARQLLALGWLQAAIAALPEPRIRDVFLTLFSGVLEFNNMFASYKGEGTGAVRHMFAHHILKPERAPIEANVWGTTKSSGSFSNLFRSRLLRAARYLEQPTELNGPTTREPGVICSPPFSGWVEPEWPQDGEFVPHSIYLSCGDSARTGLPDRSVDLVLTDPPFFDNVHYSELADFFYAWQQLAPRGFARAPGTTRSPDEVQDTDAESFTAKLEAVFVECRRILKDDGLLVFTYHHSREEGWSAMARAILRAGFVVVNSHPVKSEMSVATPKTQAKAPIQLDAIVVCRKARGQYSRYEDFASDFRAAARAKLQRLEEAGFSLSRNDRRIVLFGQLLRSLRALEEVDGIGAQVDLEAAAMEEAISAAATYSRPEEAELRR